MDNYETLIRLLYLKDQNLPVFKDNRRKRIKSCKKITDLIRVAERTCPTVPAIAFNLDQEDPEWDDDIIYPKVNHLRFFRNNLLTGAALLFYGYNSNVILNNNRLRLLRYGFPIAIGIAYYRTVFDYVSQLNKVGLFDEYCNLRAQELIEQNSFILEHEDFKRYVWWNEDFKETLERVHRQANNHEASDFADSELLLQDFVRRYTNPNDQFPGFGPEYRDILN